VSWRERLGINPRFHIRRSKVDVPTSVSDLKRTPLFDWCMDGCKSKNRHHKDVCRKELGVHAQNLLTILDALVTNIEGPV